MKSIWTGFRSPLGPGIVAFLAHKRALGCLFRVEELSLRLVDRFLGEQQIASLVAITPDVVDAFLASRPRHAPRSYNHLRGTLARLFDWLAAHEMFGPSPVRAKPRRSTQSRLPFLFDDTTARRLLDVASQLPDWGGTLLRGPTYRVIFTLLYGLGLRVGEVARLSVGDVDLTRDLLVVRQTKFYKSRLVPFGPRIHTVLSDQLARRAQQTHGLSAEMPVFSFRGERPVSAGTISQTFHHLVPKLGLVIPNGTVGPRVHDLRQHAGSRIMPGQAWKSAFSRRYRSIWRLPSRHNPAVFSSAALEPGMEETCWISSSEVATRFDAYDRESLARILTRSPSTSPAAGTPPRQRAHS